MWRVSAEQVITRKRSLGRWAMRTPMRARHFSRSASLSGLPARTAEHVVFELPVGAGDCRYFITATDQKGNVSRSALERIYLA